MTVTAQQLEEASAYHDRLARSISVTGNPALGACHRILAQRLRAAASALRDISRVERSTRNQTIGGSQ